MKCKQVTLKATLEQSKAQAQRAKAAYDQVAPFGFLSSTFADDVRKNEIEGLKSARDHALAVRDAAERAVAGNGQTLASAYESFLRDSQIPDRLEAICEEPELSAFVVPILESTKQRAIALWQVHARKHAQNSRDLEIAARGLRMFYERSLSGLPPKYLSGEGSNK
jgi:hypothetical protein